MALSREQVVQTAVDLLRRYGLADLTMRRLAREVGVAPGALYWHVANKQELLIEVSAHLLDDIREVPADLPAPEGIALLANAIRAAIATVPDASTVVGLAYAVDRRSIRPLRELVSLAARAGIPSDERDAVADLLVHHIIGSVAVEQDERQAAVLDPDHAARSSGELAKSFEIGLGIILAGLAAR